MCFLPSSLQQITINWQVQRIEIKQLESFIIRFYELTGFMNFRCGALNSLVRLIIIVLLHFIAPANRFPFLMKIDMVSERHQVESIKMEMHFLSSLLLMTHINMLWFQTFYSRRFLSYRIMNRKNMRQRSFEYHRRLVMMQIIEFLF